MVSDNVRQASQQGLVFVATSGKVLFIQSLGLVLLKSSLLSISSSYIALSLLILQIMHGERKRNNGTSMLSYVNNYRLTSEKGDSSYENPFSFIRE